MLTVRFAPFLVVCLCIMATVFLLRVLLLHISTELTQGAAIPAKSTSTSPPTDTPLPLSSNISTSPVTNTSLSSSADVATSSSSSTSLSSLSPKTVPDTTLQHVLVLCRPTTVVQLSSRANKGKPLSRNLWLIAFLCIAICIVVGPLVILIAKCLPPAEETQIADGTDD